MRFSKLFDLLGEDQEYYLGYLVYRILTLNRDITYVVCSYGIGDTLMVGSLCREYKNKLNSEKLILIVKESQKDIPVYFNSIDGRIVSDRLVRYLKLFSEKKGIYRKNNYLYAHFKLNENKKLTEEYYKSKSSNAYDKYKELVFEIPINSRGEKPYISISAEKVNKIRKEYNIYDTDKVLLLCPYAKSASAINNSTWKKMAIMLKEKGYRVFTNVQGDNEKPIEGTEALALGINELFIFCNTICHHVISLRSGICDLLVFAKCRLIVLHSEVLYYREWQVKSFYNRKNIDELCIAGKNINEILTLIEDKVDKVSI